jgi:hypothetical protein
MYFAVIGSFRVIAFALAYGAALGRPCEVRSDRPTWILAA